MKEVYLKVFLVLYLSLTIFTIVGAISVAAVEPEVGEADYLSTAVEPPDDKGYKYQCKYCGSNGDGYTYTYKTYGSDSEYSWSWAWDCKGCSCLCDCLCGNQYYC